MSPEQMNERYIRQKDVVPADRLAACKATVVGVGAIGRQVALQLTAMGIPWLQMVDFDTVDASNLASQGYLENDLENLKSRLQLYFVSKLTAELRYTGSSSRFAGVWKLATSFFVQSTRFTPGD